MAVAAEDVMLEERLPGLPLRSRSLRDRDHGEQQARVGRVRPCSESVPPVVDEAIERPGRLNLVPPQLRQVERIPGSQLAHPGLVADLSEQRKTLIILRRRCREAHGRSGHRVIDGTYVEPTDESWRVEGKTAPSRDHAGQVVERVVMTGHVGGRAEPDSRRRVGCEQRHGIGLRESRQTLPAGRGPGVDRLATR